MSGLPINPAGLPPASGFSHGIVSEGGRLLHIAGEAGHRQDLSMDGGFVAQFAQACRNLAAVVEAAGGNPTDVVAMTIYTTDVGAYRDNLTAIGEEYRAVFGRHFPAMALVGVSELVDPRAIVEISGVAVIPE